MYSVNWNRLFSGQRASLEPVRNCSNNNNSSPLHAVGLAAIAQLARQEPAPPRSPSPRACAPPAVTTSSHEFPGVLPTDVVVQLPSPVRTRERNSRYIKFASIVIPIAMR